MFGPPSDERCAEALRGYVLFSLDALRSQKFFEDNGRYKASNYDEVKRDYWDNPDFMLTNYLPGMFTSYYLWPHHYRLLRYYAEEVLPVVAGRKPKHFCEVGTGTAVYSRETLYRLPELRGTGYDISEHSLSFGARVLNAFGVADRYTFEQRDIIEDTPPPTDYLICQEVLEHLEDPAGFVEALREMVVPGGHAYITAAVTAGHSDHIYLFNNPEEVQEMLEAAGFSIVMERTEVAESANVPTLAPRVACFLCERN
jgi:SAM-dependent methyltransferase